MAHKGWEINFGEIDTAYKVLAVFLVAAESITITWLLQAPPGGKALAGISAISLLALCLVCVYALSRSGSKPVGISIDDTRVALGQGESTVRAPAARPPEGRVGVPDQWFTIGAPPPGWEVLDLSLRELVVGELGTDDEDVAGAALGGSEGTERVLVIRSPSVLTFVPLPGRTTAFGRPLPTALAIDIRLQLVVVPLARAQPPLFVERPLEENFLRAVSGLLNTGVLRLAELTSGTAGTGRRQWLARLEQQLHDVQVEGRDGLADVRLEKALFGIEGAVQDYLLRLEYVELQGRRDETLDAGLAMLRELVASFETLKPIETDKALAAARAHADREFERTLDHRATAMFESELMVTLLRFHGRDLHDLGVLDEAVRRLAPFDEWRRTGMLEELDEQVAELLDSLDAVRAGDPAPLRAALSEMIEALYEEPSSGAGPVSGRAG